MKILILLFVFSACSTQKVTTDFETVSFNSDKESKLHIDENQTGTNGQLGIEPTNEIKERDPIISLSVYSSLYSSLALVDLFKKFEKEQINISVIRANGLAAVIAAIYAKEKSSNSLEWKLFALLKKLKGIRPYNKEWKRVVSGFVENEFKDTRIEELKISLKVPQITDNKVSLIKAGRVADILSNNLDLNDKSNYFKKPAIYRRDMMESASDLNFNIVFLPQEIKFKVIDGYSWGIFTNYFGFLMKHSEDIYRIETSKDIHIDDLVPLSTITSSYTENSKKAVEKFQSELKTWKEEFTASSN